eukprot:1653940-Pleurochrysis_carterae.AAC.2
MTCWQRRLRLRLPLGEALWFVSAPQLTMHLLMQGDEIEKNNGACLAFVRVGECRGLLELPFTRWRGVATCSTERVDVVASIQWWARGAAAAYALTSIE